MRKIIYGLIGVIIILGGLAYLQTSQTPTPLHSVTYQARGEGAAYIAIQEPAGELMDIGRVSLPWSFDVDILGSQKLHISVIPVGDATVRCSIMLNGDIVDTDEGNDIAVCRSRT